MAFLIPAAIGAAGAIGSAAIGASQGASDKDKARALLEKAMAEYGRIDAPTLQRVAAEQLGPSAMEGVEGSLDPRFKQDQYAVLNQLADLSENGNDAQMKAAMNDALAQSGHQEASQRAAILDNMRARGVSGSGAELAAQLSNQQSAADRANATALNLGADSQRRMYDAMLARGQMSGQMRNQDYGEASDVAKSRDMINQYNAQNRDKANYYNAGLGQKEFDNQMAIAQGRANAANGVANNYSNQAAATQALWGGVGQGVAQAGSAATDYLAKQKKDGGY